jgi:rhodanese-related sulfurtransferase
MAIALVGLATRQPLVHFALAALGILPFWSPASHPIDRLYNLVIRPIWNGVHLPPNPLPRRIACFMGGLMNLGIGLSFVAGNVPLAYGLGGVLVALQLIVISSHFCVASWIVEVFLKALGMWVPPVEIETAREAIADGGHLIDLRNPDEFAREHLPGAENVPLERLKSDLAGREGECFILYCAGGLRSQQGTRLLRKCGFESVHNLGSMSRWTHSE